VAKMHHIYRKAQSVYVWLGKEEDGSGEAMDAIKNLKIPAEPQLSNIEFLLKLLEVKTKSPKLFDDSLFKPLAALSRRSWFQRLWVVQEYYYGKSVQFFCGYKQVDGVKFIEALRNLTINSFGSVELPRIADEDDLFSGFQALKDLEKIKEAQSSGREGPSFFDSVVLGRERLAKEPVDHIYAVFGMAGNFDEVYQQEIPVDYSEEARAKYWRLYSIFGKIALRQEPNLRLLSIVSSRERPDELPSWCPNLQSPMVMDDMYAECSYSAGWPWASHAPLSGFRDCTGHPHFKGKEHNYVSVSSNSNTISIWGARLGRISAVGQPRQWDLDMYTDDISKAKPFAKAVLRWLSDSERFCGEHCKNEAAALHIWNEVLVGAGNKSRRPRNNPDSSEKIIIKPREDIEIPGDSDNALDSQPAGQSMDRPGRSVDIESSEVHETDVGERVLDLADLDDGDRAYAFLQSVLEQIVQLSPDVDWREQNPRLLRNLQAAYVWLMVIAQSWSNRVLFATGNGYIGYSSEEVVAGDNAVVLYSGPTWYILRENGPGNRFVSDAYIYDCVDGEIFEMLDEGLVVEELFSIC
jgi:Heterokaryon incompatibility protein (HET)